MKTIKYVCILLILLIGLPTALANSVTIINNLPQSSVCQNGNTVSVFSPTQTVLQPKGGSFKISGDFSSAPGIGLQVNNWYWTSISLPVQSNPQNPDNSGAQFMISSDCRLSQTPPWYGKGIPTYLIAKVSASKDDSGNCTVTISENSYTNAVTPGCCSPPGIGSGSCAGPWGVTNSGQHWPPSS